VIRTINLFTKAVPDTPTSWLDKFSSVWLVGEYYYSSIDGVSDDGTRRVIHEHMRAHGLPEEGSLDRKQRIQIVRRLLARAYYRFFKDWGIKVGLRRLY
jgi:ABC-type phosphonate transport system ATPase subunit